MTDSATETIASVTELFPAPPVRLVKDTLPTPVRFARSRRAVRLVRLAATDPRTGAALALGVRHSMYVVGGARVVTRSYRDGRTASRYERLLQAAEAAGNLEEARCWEERGASFRAARHQRRMQLLLAPQAAAKGAAVGVGAGAAGLLLLGGALAIATEDASMVVAPTMLVIDVIRWACVIAAVVWSAAKVAGLPLLLLALWGVGRHRGTAPQWAMPAGHRSDDGAPITPSAVVQALRDLGIAPLGKAIKAMGDAGAGMLSPIVIAGCGVEVDVLLPSGVSSDQVQDRRRRLAENLARHEHEVFITIPPAARSVRLWIADSGALDEPIGPSPLVLDESAKADYKTGKAPWGQDLRGDAAMPSLYQRHLLCTGLSNQGKTASLRALALWLALDPTVEFRLGDLKGIGDWSMFDGLATVLIEGPTDEHVIAVTEMLEGAVSEMERRMLAPKGTAFPPLVILVDEAQVAFMCPAKGEDGRQYGGVKATSRYFNAARKLHNQGRAVSVTLWQGTQDPTDANLPKLVREGAHIRASLVLGTESQARMALGDKAIDGGAAPHKLRQGLDKGTLVVAGDHGIKMGPGQSSITVRTHFIDDDDATAIADRAKARRSGVTTLSAVDTGEPADHLADIAAVLGDAPKLRTQEVLQLLAQHNPSEYREWTPGALKAVLTLCGHGEYKTNGGVMHVSRERMIRALEERADDDSE